MQTRAENARHSQWWSREEDGATFTWVNMGHSCCLQPRVPRAEDPTFLPHWKRRGNCMQSCGKTKANGHRQSLSCHSPGLLASAVCWVQLCAPHWEGVYVLNILCRARPDSRTVGHVFLHTPGSQFAATTGCGLRPAQHSRSGVSFTQGICKQCSANRVRRGHLTLPFPFWGWQI